jgi:hypothetical protein
LGSILFVLCTMTLHSQQTRAERTNYVETSRYDDVVAFLDTVAKESRLVHNTTFGNTVEGRALPLAVVGRVGDVTPRTVRASGKLRVYIQANIHAGEVEGKEASLDLLFGSESCRKSLRELKRRTLCARRLSRVSAASGC